MSISTTDRTGGAASASPVRLDGHADLPGSETDAVSIDKLRAGGVTALVQAVRADVHPSDSHHAGLDDLNSGRAAIDTLLANGLTLARTPNDVRRIAAEGGIALILELQNAAPLESVDDFATWLEAGVSVVGLTFIGNNRWAESSRPYPFASNPREVAGLSPLGREAVGYLNRAGTIVDVSQLSDRAIVDVLDVSRTPVLASHTGLRRRVNANRNLPDAIAKDIAAAGGVIQLVAFGMYLRKVEHDLVPALADLWRNNGLAVPTDATGFYSVDDPATSTWDADHFYEFLHEFHVILKLDEPTATVSDLVDAIESAADLVGIDALGISSDFNHGGGIVGWIDASETGHVVNELHERGYPESTIDKLFGGNFLRLWDAVLTGTRR